MKAQLLVLAVLLLAPLSARADELPRDAIVVLDDGDLRGRIVELKPGESLTLVLPSGKRTVVPWAKVIRIAVDQDAPRPTTTTPTATPTTAPREATAGGGMTVIKVQSEATVQLQGHVSGSDRWETQCFSPCDVVVPTNGAYRIVDEGGHPLETIQLRGRKSLGLEVSPASGAIRALSITATVVGGIAFLGGISGKSGAWTAGGGLLTTLGVVGLLLNRTTVNEVAIGQARSLSLPVVARSQEEGDRATQVHFDIASRRTDVAGFTIRF
mgnify:CR=1 FL=1